MKNTTLVNILLLVSLLLLSPLTENPQEANLVQNTPKSVAVEIHQPEIKITSSFVGTIVFNVTYFQTSDNNTEIILTNGLLDEFNPELVIKAKDAGFYIFDFISTHIGKVTIEAQGIYQMSWIIISIFSLLKLIMWTKSRYF
ncbi:MAG: hypothetical protein GPJ54_08635 [Candidatus Heimdallarchaeota archaeon]|nr:hypothetical protein [Candidatus Heimdallarchaeota archaeon]